MGEDASLGKAGLRGCTMTLLMDGALASLPDAIFSLVVTHPLGELRERAPAVAVWRLAWLRGEWPTEESWLWPNGVVRHAIRQWVDEQRLLKLCAQSVALTDELMARGAAATGASAREASGAGHRAFGRLHPTAPQ